MASRGLELAAEGQAASVDLEKTRARLAELESKNERLEKVFGEPEARLADGRHGAVALGLDRGAAPAVARQGALLRRGVPDAVALSAYANIGYADNRGNLVPTDAVAPDRYADYAASWVEAGASIALNTDAHRPEHFDELRYGIMTARRGWLEAERCVNTWSARKLMSWLRSKR